MQAMIQQYGLAMLLVGMLVLLIMGCVLLSRTGKMAQGGQSRPAAPGMPMMPQGGAQQNGALIAVITAAVAAAMGEEAAQGGFVVKSIRRAGGSAWSRAGREEQMYSRM